MARRADLATMMQIWLQVTTAMTLPYLTLLLIDSTWFSVLALIVALTLFGTSSWRLQSAAESRQTKSKQVVLHLPTVKPELGTRQFPLPTPD
jgi:hypothetical protein